MQRPCWTLSSQPHHQYSFHHILYPEGSERSSSRLFFPLFLFFLFFQFLSFPFFFIIIIIFFIIIFISHTIVFPSCFVVTRNLFLHTSCNNHEQAHSSSRLSCCFRFLLLLPFFCILLPNLASFPTHHAGGHGSNRRRCFRDGCCHCLFECSSTIGQHKRSFFRQTQISQSRTTS